MNRKVFNVVAWVEDFRLIVPVYKNNKNYYFQILGKANGFTVNIPEKNLENSNLPPENSLTTEKPIRVSKEFVNVT